MRCGTVKVPRRTTISSPADPFGSGQAPIKDFPIAEGRGARTPTKPSHRLCVSLRKASRRHGRSRPCSVIRWQHDFMRNEWQGGGWLEFSSKQIALIAVRWLALSWLILPINILGLLLFACVPPLGSWYMKVTGHQRASTPHRLFFGIPFVPVGKWVIMEVRPPRLVGPNGGSIACIERGEPPRYLHEPPNAPYPVCHRDRTSSARSSSRPPT